MRGKGKVEFGGAVAGAVFAQITMDNGENWEFTGGVIGFQFGLGMAYEVSGDFPGHSHMSGPCTLSIWGAAVGPGNFEVRWGDLQGPIGTVNGKGIGMDISAAVGFGGWTKK